MGRGRGALHGDLLGWTKSIQVSGPQGTGREEFKSPLTTPTASLPFTVGEGGVVGLVSLLSHLRQGVALRSWAHHTEVPPSFLPHHPTTGIQAATSEGMVSYTGWVKGPASTSKVPRRQVPVTLSYVAGWRQRQD